MTDKIEIFLNFLSNIPRFLLFLMSESSFDHIIGPKNLIECFPYITVLHLVLVYWILRSSARIYLLVFQTRLGGALGPCCFLPCTWEWQCLAIVCCTTLIDWIFLAVPRNYFVCHETLLLSLVLELFQVADDLMTCRSGIPIRNMLGVVELLFYVTLI